MNSSEKDSKPPKPISRFQFETAFLSNFYPCPVEIDGLIFHSSEAAYMAQKTDSKKIKERFAEISNAAHAKKEGRRIKLKEGWDNIKLKAMLTVVTAKFEQNPFLANLLVNTGDRPLIEGNDWGDTYWGVCKGEGENHLGLILMEVRKRIVRENKKNGVTFRSSFHEDKT